MSIFEKLQGKKTYLIMGFMVLQAIYAFCTGDATLGDAVSQALLGTGLGTLRAGVKK